MQVNDDATQTLRRDESPVARDTLAEILVVETGLAHSLAGLGRVHESALPRVDADMRDLATRWDQPKENEVPRSQFTCRDGPRCWAAVRGTRMPCSPKT
jgi:hypothetical protein